MVEPWNYIHNLGYYVLNDLKVINDMFIVGGGWGGIIVKSQNRGETWETTFLPDEVEIINIAGTVNNLLALTKSEDKNILYRSTDQGTNWIKVYEPDTTFNTVACKSDSEFWLGGKGGKILRSTNSGINWEKFNYLYEQNFNAVCFKSKFEGYIVGDKGTILKTTNAGKSWNYTNSPTDSNLIDIEFYPLSNSGFLISSDGKIFKSVDGGSSWINVYSDPSLKVKKVSFITADQILAVGDSNLVLLSTNFGETWVISNKNIDISSKFINISIPSPECIYLGYENIIYKSTDTAKTWNKFYQDELRILSFNFPSRNNGYIFSQSLHNIIIAKNTTDGGLTCSSEMINFLEHTLTNFKSAFPNDSIGYLLGSLLISTINGGRRWNINYNINGNDIYIDSDLTGWIVGNDGAIISNVEFDDIILPPIYEVMECKLHQNYPNPFNAGTLIEYEVLPDGYVILKIFDILGKEVDRLVDKFQKAGRYTLLWQPQNLPSGIYFYNLQFNNHLLTRKMCLIK